MTVEPESMKNSRSRSTGLDAWISRKTKSVTFELKEKITNGGFFNDKEPEASRQGTNRESQKRKERSR